MKQLPQHLNRSKYKYNIMDRLALLSGGVSNLSANKRLLIAYLKARGAREGTIRRWLVIEKGVKHEIPLSALSAIRDFINQKNETENPPRLYGESMGLSKISVEDLYNEGQLKILPSY